MVKEKANVKSSVLEAKQVSNLKESDKKEKTAVQSSVPRSNASNVGGNKSLGKFIVRKKNHLYL